jgi:glycosyltransferase involved in cell wall biosynthesis
MPIVLVVPPEGRVLGRFRELALEACYVQELGMDVGRIRGTLGSLALADPRGKQRTIQLLRSMKELHDCNSVLCQYPREQVLASQAARNLGYRVIWIVHSKLHFLCNRLFVSPFLRRAIRGADLAFVISRSTKAALEHDGFPPEKMRLLPVGVEVPTDLRPRTDRVMRVGVVSRLVYWKGVHYVLRAAPEIIRQFPGVEFLVAGEGRYRRRLERLAKQLGIDASVRFLGFREDPWEVYQRINILAHATFDPGDSMPTSILEAGAAGVPSVATRWSGIPEIVRDGETGLLVPAHDVNALVGAIRRLLEDGQFAARLGARAREFVLEGFTMKQVGRSFAEQFQRSAVLSRTHPDV